VRLRCALEARIRYVGHDQDNRRDTTTAQCYIPSDSSNQVVGHTTVTMEARMALPKPSTQGRSTKGLLKPIEDQQKLPKPKALTALPKLSKAQRQPGSPMSPEQVARQKAVQAQFRGLFGL
jgi:hypothetical protein